MLRKTRPFTSGLILITALTWAQAALAVPVLLRDISHLQGLRENQLIGYGLVVGLQGTGDSRQSGVTSRSMANMLEKFGLDLGQRDFSTRNSAAVMVTATLLPFARPGEKIDVGISSIGDAKSLQGGTLLLTPLYAGNQQVYASAQGPISVGGYYAAQSFQSIVKNVTTTGTLANGAIIEKTVGSEFLKDNQLVLSLERTDFDLANQVVKRINDQFGTGVAKTANGTDIEITLPAQFQSDPSGFVGAAQNLKVESGSDARVVIDERTGTVVVGGDVRISKVAITHGSLHVAIAGETQVSQPLPFSQGRTVVAEQLSMSADEGKSDLVVLPEGSSIEELVRALNAIGTLPRDTIVILQNLKAIGALHGQIFTR